MKYSHKLKIKKKPRQMKKGDKNADKGVQIPKEDEEAEAKNEGGKEVGEEVKLSRGEKTPKLRMKVPKKSMRKSSFTRQKQILRIRH